MSWKERNVFEIAKTDWKFFLSNHEKMEILKYQVLRRVLI